MQRQGRKTSGSVADVGAGPRACPDHYHHHHLGFGQAFMKNLIGQPQGVAPTTKIVVSVTVCRYRSPITDN